MERYASPDYNILATDIEEDLNERWQRFVEAGADTVLDALTGDDADAQKYRAADPDRQPAAYGLDGHDDEEPAGYRELAVVERPMRDGLFGFTRTDSDHVNVNEALYAVDKEKTVRHEKTHHLHPKDEMTIRYINGDIDVQHTISYAADNAGRIGNGNVERHQYGS